MQVHFIEVAAGSAFRQRRTPGSSPLRTSSSGCRTPCSLMCITRIACYGLCASIPEFEVISFSDRQEVRPGDPGSASTLSDGQSSTALLALRCRRRVQSRSSCHSSWAVGSSQATSASNAAKQKRRVRLPWAVPGSRSSKRSQKRLCADDIRGARSSAERIMRSG